ncbi:MAG: lactate racemase domain-containing protein [Candidatus Freyarchaeota archaeon]
MVTVNFPEDTTVLTHPPPLTPLRNPKLAVCDALENPVGEQPLSEILEDCRKITVAFDDPALPIPLPREDPRKIVVDEVLRVAEAAVVAVKLVCANGTHRKWSSGELSSIIGGHAKRAACHDAEDNENLKELGSVNGMPVTVNRNALCSCCVLDKFIYLFAYFGVCGVYG